MNAFNEYTNHAILMAREAGEIVKGYYKKDNLVTESKGYNDIATEADKASEDHIKKMINEKFPDHKILAEESGTEEGNDGFMWVIDPIDGTNNFSHKMPIFSISIALEIEGEIASGVVYVPLMDEMFVAEKGKGAFLNDSQIHVSKTNEKELSMVATGFSPSAAMAEENLKNFNFFMTEGWLIRRLGSAAIDLAYVACGRFDGFWELGLKPWDIAAGSLLVTEAGGKLTDCKGEKHTLSSRDILASNSELHPLMIRTLEKAQ